MKILLIGPVYPFRGGIAHYTTRLAQELSKSHRVCVLSFRKQFPAWLYPGRSDRDPSQKTLTVEAERLLEPLNPLAWWRSASWIRRQRPDVVIFQWWVTFWSPAFASVARLCRRWEIPVLFLIHNVLPHEGGRIHRPIARLALRQGSAFIVHTAEERQRLLSLLPTAEVQVCPFPVYDMLSSPAAMTKAEARRRLGLPEGERLALFFGIVRPYKGLKYLLEALAGLRAENELVHLLVAGEFWESKADYLACIHRLNLQDQVRLEDRYIPNEELETFFTAADLVVAPYIGGTQSAVASLAMGYGLPLVATQRGAAGIDPENAGQVQVVPPADARALAEAIKNFFQNPVPASPRPQPAGSDGWRKIAAAVEHIVSGMSF